MYTSFTCKVFKSLYDTVSSTIQHPTLQRHFYLSLLSFWIYTLHWSLPPAGTFFTKNQRETHHWCGVSRSNLLSNTSQMINFDYTWCCRLIWWFFNLLLLLNDFCIIAIKIFLCLESVYRHNIKAIKNLSSKGLFI